MAPNRISIWLGDIDVEEKLEQYLSDEFASDFGFEIDEPAGPEMAAQQESDVYSLLKGFSAWKTFADSAVDLAGTQGVHKACAAIVFYNFE